MLQQFFESSEELLFHKQECSIRTVLHGIDTHILITQYHNLLWVKNHSWLLIMNSTRILPSIFSIKICLPKSNCEYGTVLIMRFQKHFGPILLAKPILRKEGRRASGMKKNHSIKPAYCIFAYYTSREQYQSITSLVGGHFGCLDTSKTQFVTNVLM